MTIQNGIYLHSGQAEVWRDPARFKVVVAGRRWGKCLAAGTRVTLADGSTRRVENIRAGDEVLTVNEQTYRLEPKPVLHLHDNGIRETLCLTTRLGRRITTTPNHPFLVNNTWIEAGDIQPGALIASPKRPSDDFSDYRVPVTEYQLRHLTGALSIVAHDVLSLWGESCSGFITKSLYRRLRAFYGNEWPSHFDPLVDNDLAWDEVIAVESAGRQSTFDLTVQDNHNFIASDLVTHNTALARGVCIKKARKPRSKVWYIAPSYRMAKQIMWADLKDVVPRQWVRKYHETELSIKLINGSVIECKGADDPDSLRGVGLNYVVLDEFQDMKSEVWSLVIRPTLARDRGHAMFIGCVTGDTKIMTRSGVSSIESHRPTNSQPGELSPIDLPVYGVNREFHTADGFWNQGVVPTKKIKTHYGFEIEGSHRHPLLTMSDQGEYEWKRCDDIEPGDRVAIGRAMEVWGNKDPCAGFSDHIESWRSERDAAKTKAAA